MTFVQRLLEAGRHTRSRFVGWADGGWHSATWDEVVADSRHAVAGLRHLGVGPGRTVAALLTNHPSTVRGLLAVWLAGGAVASMPAPARGMDPRSYADQLTHMIGLLDPPVVLVDRDQQETLAGLGGSVPVRSWESVLGTGTGPETPPEGEDVAFVQYSSGSTARPKGCVLTARAVEAQLDLMYEHFGMVAADTTASWLPLSHDMGMFGTLLESWSQGASVVMSTPQRFGMSPGTWFSDMAEFGAAFTAGSSTALTLAAKRGGRSPVPGRLDRLRGLIVGAEPVQWEAMERAVEAFAPIGLRRDALTPSYGLAENVLAASGKVMGTEPRRLHLSGEALSEGELVLADGPGPGVTTLVSAGPPIRGVEVTVPEGGVGEVVIRSPSLAEGYHADPERTAAHFRDGALHTNDLGLLHEGHFYPVGRTDDLVSIAGRKIFAGDVEGAVNGIPQVRTGSCVLVPSEGSQRLTLLLETTATSVDRTALAREAASRALEVSAIAVDECVFLRRGSLPKTPSGKVARHRCIQALDAGALAVDERVALGAVRS